jgi:hypothetical protein
MPAPETGTPSATSTSDPAGTPGPEGTPETGPTSDPVALPDTVSTQTTVALPDTAGWWRRQEPDASGGGPGSPYPTVTGTPPPYRPRRPRSHLFGLTMAVAAIALGAIWVYDDTGHHVDPSVYPGTVLAVIAAALLIGAWWGRSRLLILVGVLATIATLVTSVVGVGPFGRFSYAPATAAAVRPSYHMGAGDMSLFLMGVRDVQNLNGRSVALTGGAGKIMVLVPPGIDLTVNAKVQGGEVLGLGSPVESHSSTVDLTWADPDDADPNLTVDVDLRYGQVVFTRAICTGPHFWSSEPLLASNADLVTKGGATHEATCN